MSRERQPTLSSLVTLPSNWVSVVVLSGVGAAVTGLLVTFLVLTAVGVSPGDSDAAEFLVGGSVPAVKGAIWFYFDTHWVASRTGPQLTGLVVTAHPLQQADPALWPLHAIPAVVGVGPVAAVRYLDIDDPLTGVLTGVGTMLGYLPTMVLLQTVSRVSLTRHATDGRVPISDADGIPVSQASGVTAGPEFLSTLVFVTMLGLSIGAIAGAVGTLWTTRE